MIFNDATALQMDIKRDSVIIILRDNDNFERK